MLTDAVGLQQARPHWESTNGVLSNREGEPELVPVHSDAPSINKRIKSDWRKQVERAFSFWDTPTALASHAYPSQFYSSSL